MVIPSFTCIICLEHNNKMIQNWTQNLTYPQIKGAVIKRMHMSIECLRNQSLQKLNEATIFLHASISF